MFRTFKDIIFLFIVLLGIVSLFSYCSEPTPIIDTNESINCDSIVIKKEYLIKTLREDLDNCLNKSFLDNNIKKIVPAKVRVDTISRERLSGVNLLDGKPYFSKTDKGTRWAAPGYPHWLIFYFDSLVFIKYADVNVFGWDEGYAHSITIFNYSDSIVTFETSWQLYHSVYLDLKTTTIAFRINGGKNSWSDIGEIKFFGK